MNKKSIIIAAILIVLYFLIFFVTGNTKGDKKNRPLPIITIPICKVTYTTAGLLQNGDTICYNETDLLLIKNAHEAKLETFDKTNTPYYIGTVDNYLLKAQEQSISLYQITSDAKLSSQYTINLAKNETLISHFTVTEESITYLYLTIMREVAKPTENRTALYFLTLENPNKITIKKRLELLHMEKIANVIGSPFSPVIITTEMFPFLINRVQVYKFSNKLDNITPACAKIENFIARMNFVAMQVSQCTRFSDGWYTISDKGNYSKTLEAPLLTCLVTEKDYSLCIKDGHILYNESTNQQITLPLSIEHYSTVIQRYSTTINKNVYNCNDFGESSQITLRVCIPIL